MGHLKARLELIFLFLKSFSQILDCGLRVGQITLRVFQLMQKVLLLFRVTNYGDLFYAVLKHLFQLLFRLLRLTLGFY